MELLSYQKEAVAQMCRQNVTLLADEPGLGKTAQSIAVINARKLKRILIIVPASLKLNWRAELLMWLDCVLSIYIVNTSKDVIPQDINVVIINYDLVSKPKILEQLHAIDFQMVICDEAHYLKNPESKRTAAILGFRPYKKGLVKNAKFKLMLTGTPVINSPMDLWPIANKLFKNLIAPYSNFFNFSERYMGAGYDNFDNWVMGEPSNLDELAEKIKPVIIRRLKADVLTELPKKRYQIVAIESTKKLNSLIKQENEILSKFDNMALVDHYPFEEMAVLRQKIGLAKIDKSALYIENMLNSGVAHLVVFLHHREAIDLLNEKLKKYGTAVIRGDTKLADREQIVKTFQKTEKIRVLICNLKSGGVGLTLTRASDVIFIEMPWTSAEVHQAVDRCHRIGQHESVLAQFLVIEKSFDAKLINTILRKEEIVKQIIGRDSDMNTQTVQQNLDKIELLVNDTRMQLKLGTDVQKHSEKEIISVVDTGGHTIALEDIIAKVKAVFKALGRSAVLELLALFDGAKSAGEIAEDDYEQFIEVCNDALAKQGVVV